MRRLPVLPALALASAVAPLVASAAPAAPAKPEAAARPSAPHRAEWESFKKRFVTPRGRVVDTGNNHVSHSEGQGYAMLLAVANDDRATFDLLWTWTREQLCVREDALLAWRWKPTPYGGFVDDMNDASDGDILVAWALLRAGHRWAAPALLETSRRMREDIVRLLVVEKDGFTALLPGVSGFTMHDGVVVNLSYYVFPAFADFAREDPRPGSAWPRLLRDGESLARSARFGAPGLASNWIFLGERAHPTPAPARPAVFGYDALRIPLYLAWHKPGSDALTPYAAWWSSKEFRSKPAVEVALDADAADKITPAVPGAGVSALIDTVLRLSGRGTNDVRSAPGFSAPRGGGASEDYYQSVLGLIARLARESANRPETPYER